MSPTSATTFSLQLEIASKDSLSVVENTSTQAWAPVRAQNKNVIYLNETTLRRVRATFVYSEQFLCKYMLNSSLLYSAYILTNISTTKNWFLHILCETPQNTDIFHCITERMVN